MAIKDKISEIRELRWKDLYPKEKKAIFAIISFIITTLLILLVSFSIYAWILKNNPIFDKYIIFKDKNLIIYRPNIQMIEALKQTPNAKSLLYKYMSLSLLFNTILWILVFAPIDWIKPNTSQGSARWAKFEDLGYKRFFLLDKYAKPFQMNLLEEKGVVVGEYNGRILHDDAKTHILVSAPTRTGKGVSIIIPTLVDTWKDSVFVLDIKGENMQMTAGWRQKEFKNKILKFSPKKEDSCKFNPLEEIRYLTDREIEDAKTVADLIIQDESNSDPFWTESGSDFLLGIIIYVLYQKDGKGSLTDVVNFITDPSAPIEDRFRNFLSGNAKMNLSDETKEKLKEIYPTEINIINNDQHPFVVRTFADLLSKGEKTMPGIIATVKAKLGVFQMPTVAKNTSSSDFKIRDLMAADNPISFYVVIEPGDLQSLAPLLRILIIQCVTLLTPEIDYSGHNKNAIKFKHRLLMLLDEFPSIGKMEILEKAIGYVAGFGMKMMLVVQSLDQLNKIYTKDNAFISNCQTQIFYTANDNQTAEYISQTIGNKTIKSTSVSHNGGIFSSRNKNDSYQGVPLIRPDEVRRLSLDTILILNASKPPIKSKKILWFYDTRFKHKVNIPIQLSTELKKEFELQKELKK